jgi:hypothetical protein
VERQPRERLRATLLTRDSILIWALTTCRRRKRDHTRIQSAPGYAHLAVVRRRSPRAARQWVAGVRFRSALPECASGVRLQKSP